MADTPSPPPPVGLLAEIAPVLPARGALLGLDLGTKTIGVATCDPDRRLATGVETVLRTKFGADAARLMALAADRRGGGIVLGLPPNMGGSEGPRAQASRAFPPNLRPLFRPAGGVLGRAALHRRGGTGADRRRCQPGEAGGGGGPACRDLHPPGRAGFPQPGPARERCRNRRHGVTPSAAIPLARGAHPVSQCRISPDIETSQRWGAPAQGITVSGGLWCARAGCDFSSRVFTTAPERSGNPGRGPIRSCNDPALFRAGAPEIPLRDRHWRMAGLALEGRHDDRYQQHRFRP